MSPGKQRKWYSAAVDHVGPLRFHLHEILQEIEAHNSVATRAPNWPKIREDKIRAARTALNKAEAFFTGIKPRR